MNCSQFVPANTSVITANAAKPVTKSLESLRKGEYMNNLHEQIESVMEFEGQHPTMYMLRGHIDKETFLKALLVEHLSECSIDRVWHSYFRNIPVPSHPDCPMIMVKTKGPARGAYPVTHVNV
jgi:hypothetical protein